jgi:RNA polymerase sigma-70 factor (ECF subfamily)
VTPGPEDRERIDAEVRALVAAGRTREAAELALARYGAELYDYVRRLVGDEARAADAFQVASLRLWQGLAGFSWRASLRTWAFAVARNAAWRALEDPFGRRGRRLGTAEQEQVVAGWARTTTERWRQTAEKERLWALVAALSPEDREVVVLRLGRQMSWNEVAEVLHGGAPPADERKRLAAAARKRFERVKARLAAELA